jgi:hypothetical protein
VIVQLLQLVGHKAKSVHAPRCAFRHRHVDVVEDFGFNGQYLLVEAARTRVRFPESGMALRP